MNGALYEHHRDIDKIGKPVDRTDWGMTPPTVNAYYNACEKRDRLPRRDPAAPLLRRERGRRGQLRRDRGRHRARDDARVRRPGRKFDAQGNQKKWWTPEDRKNYEERAPASRNSSTAYVVEGDLHQNGKLVLGESIADLGGADDRLQAFVKSLEGKPAPRQHRRVHAGSASLPVLGARLGDQRRPEFERLMINTNPHPLGRFRAIGAPRTCRSSPRPSTASRATRWCATQRCVIW